MARAPDYTVIRRHGTNIHLLLQSPEVTPKKTYGATIREASVSSSSTTLGLMEIIIIMCPGWEPDQPHHSFCGFFSVIYRLLFFKQGHWTTDGQVCV